MTERDYKTLRVPEDAWAEAKEQKEAAGRTWGEQIVRPNGDAPTVEGYGDGENGLFMVRDGEVVAGELIERLTELVERVPERTADEVEARFR